MSRRVGNLMTRINSSLPLSESSTSSGRHLWNDIAKSYDSTYGSVDPKSNYRNQRFNRNSGHETNNEFNVEDLDKDLESYIAKRNITKQ